ncbi:hypothetical protein [Simkania negevensis]|nr:hypothetical protein [Simkania negevensis]
MTNLKSISSTHLKEMSCFGLSGGLLSTLIEGATKTRESVVQVLALGVLNQFAFHVTSHLMQGQYQTSWSRLVMGFVTVGLSASVFASLLSVDSLLTGYAIGIAHLFFHSYFFPSFPNIRYSSASVSLDHSNNQAHNKIETNRAFFLPDADDLTARPGSLCYRDSRFIFLHGHLNLSFIYGLMRVIDLKPNEGTLERNGQNCLLAFCHQEENLVRQDGTVSTARKKPISECDYLVSETMVSDENRKARALFMDLIKGLYDKNHAFPKKLFIPYSEAGYHAAGLVVEFKDSEIDVTGFDSMGGTTMIRKAAEELKAVLKVVVPTCRVKTVVTEKNQNNNLCCGFHAVHNIFRAARFEGSIFNAVQESNRKGLFSECFPYVDPKELYDNMNAFRRIAIETLQEFLQDNPGMILVKGKPYDVDLSHDPRSW